MAARVVEIAALVAWCGACSLDAVGAYEAATGGAGGSTGTSVASSGGAGAGASGSASGAGGSNGASGSSAGGNETVGGAGGSGGVGGGSCDDHALETQVEDGLSLQGGSGEYCESEGAYSFGAWVRPSLHAGTLLQYLNTSLDKGFRLWLDAGGVHADVFTESADCSVTASPLPLHAWSYVSATRRDGMLILRVDAGTSLSSTSVSCSGDTLIPGMPSVVVGKGYSGQLDDAFVECDAHPSDFDPRNPSAFNGAEVHFDFERDPPWTNVADDAEATQVGSPAYPCRAP